MKRRDLIRHLESNGFVLLREGGRHSIYINTGTAKAVAVPRHNELKEGLVRRLCRDAEIKDPLSGKR